MKKGNFKINMYIYYCYILKYYNIIRYWRRYIYIWYSYATWEEVD